MAGPEQNDAEIVSRVLSGESELYAELVRRHEGMVASIAWRYGIRRDSVEDVTADVFLKVYQKLDRYRPTHAFSTWLYRVAVNEVLDRLRRARREAPPIEEPERLPAKEPGARARLLEDERARLAREALAELRSMYREVITMVHVEGRSVADASSRLGIPEGTVKTRLMRGRQAMRRYLEERHPEVFGGQAP